MRNSLFLATAAFALAATACSKNDTDTADANMDMNADMNMANDMSMVNDMNMANGNMATPMTAAGFVNTVAGIDMYEIESGKLAQSMGSTPAIKAIGTMLVTDHGKSTAMLKTAAAASSPAVMLPTAMPAEHQAHLDQLKAAKGAEFDRMFIEQQKEGHHMALETLEAYAKSGDSPSLKAFAATAAGVVDSHHEKIDATKM